MEWLKQNLALVALIVAAVALVQNWVIALLKHIFFPGRLDVYETSNLEVGYCELGPTVGMTGTVRAVSRDMFVRRMKVVLKAKGGTVSQFEWDVFRERKITVGKDKGTELESPTGFMVSTLKPQPFNIQFHDIDTLSTMRQAFFDVHQAWSDMLTSIPPEELEQLHAKVANLPAEMRDPYAPRFEAFAQGDIFKKAADKLRELCPWKPGEYRVKLVVQTAKPTKMYERETHFTLTAEEVDALGRNVDKILMDVCNRPTASAYFFSYPRSQDLSIA